MSVDNDMKIVLQASLDTSSKGIKGLKDDIKTLKDSLKEERLGLNAKLNTNGQAVKRIKDDIEELTKKVAEKKLALNCTLNITGESKKEINEKIKSLSNNKSISPLKLRVQLNIDKDTISNINKQIDTLAKSLNNLSLKASVTVDEDNVKTTSSEKNTQNKKSSTTNLSKADDSNKANEDSLKNQNKLLKEVKKTTGDIVTETKTYQNSLTEIEQVTTNGKQGEEQKLQSIQKINDYQKTSNSLYQRQIQIEQELVKWNNLKKNASEEELQIIERNIQALQDEQQSNAELLKNEQLHNAELEKQIESKREMNQLTVDQKEMLREMKLGEDTGYEDKNLFGNQDAIEEWAKSVHGANVSISNYKTKIKSLNDQQSQFTVATKSSRGMVTEYTYAVDKATGKVFKLGERVREAGRRTIDLANDFKIAIARLTEWNVAMFLVQGTIKKFQEGVEFIKQLDNQLTQVAMVTGRTREEVQGLTQDYIDMAKSTSKTISEISAVNTELTRQGLGEVESNERLETILKLSSVASMDVNNTLSIITSSVNALGESAEHTADVLVKAGNISASSVESIGTAMTKVASSAKSNGMAIEELTGITATLIDVTQEAPETLGNSLKSMMARFSKINELGELNEDLNDVQKAFASVGIAFTDAEGQIRPFYELCSEMAEKWVDLDQNQKAYIATMSAGTMQGNRFIAMMENWNRVNSITTELQNSADGTLDDSYLVWQESIEASLNRIQIAWEELYTHIISSDALIYFFESVGFVVESLAGAFETFGVGGIAVMSAITGMMLKGNKFVQVFNAMKTSTSLLSGVMNSLKTIFTVTTVAENNQIKTELLHQKVLTSLGVTQKLSEVGWRAYGMAVVGATAKTVALGVATAVATGGLTLLAGLLTGALFSGISAYSDNVEEANESAEELINTSKDSIKTHSNNAKSLKEVSAKYKEYQKRIESGSEALKLNAKEQSEYNDIVSQMAEISPSIISGYDEQGNAIVKYGTQIDDLIEKEQALIEIEKQRILANSNNLTQEVKEEMENLKEKEKIYKLMLAEGLSEEKATKTHGQYDDSYVDRKYEEKIEKMETLKEAIKNTTIDMNDGDSDNQLKKLDSMNEELQKLESTYKLVLAKTQVLNADIDETKDKLNEVADIKIDDAFDGLNLSDSVRALGEDLAITVFRDAIDEDIDNSQMRLEEALRVFEDLYGELDDLLTTGSEESVHSNAEALKLLADRLTELGIPSEEAISWIYQISLAMTEGKEMTDAFAMSISGLSSYFTDSMDEIDKLQGYMKKLSKSQRLSSEEILDMMENYEGIAEYIAETGDLYLENGELVNEILEEKIGLMLNTITSQQELAQQEEENLKAELELHEKRRDTLKIILGEQSKAYQDELEKIDSIKSELSSVTAEMGKLQAQAKVFELYAKEDYNLDGLEIARDMYKEVTDEIAEYNELLIQLKKEGLSSDLIDQVLSEHIELIDVLDDEGAMYERLQQLIAEKEQAQIDSYQRMQQYSASYLQTILNSNASLFNQLTTMYGTDLANFTNLYQLKADMFNQLAKAMNGSYNDYANMSDAELENLRSNLENDLGNSTNLDSNLKAIEIIEAMQGIKQTEAKTLEFKTQKANFQSINAGRISGKGKSGSSRSSSLSGNNLANVELETDAYIKLTKAMEELERQQKNNQRITEYASGKDRIELLSKEIDMLRKKQVMTHNIAEEYRKELATLEKSLAKKIGLNDGANGMNNYLAYIKKQEDAINSYVKQINSATSQTTIDKLTEKKDKLEEEIDKFQEDFERYLEIKLNTIPDLSDEWWEMVYEQFEYTLQIMETDLEKYAKKIAKVNSSLGYILQGRNDNTKVLEKEYELMVSMADIYEEEIANIKDKITANSSMVEKYEKQLASISDKQSDTYIATSKYLTLARYEQDKLAEALQTALDEYSAQLNNQISKHIELLNDMKEKAVETFETMRNELDEFSTKEFEVELNTILAELDKIDGIFMRNPQYTLSTSEARDEIDKLESSIGDMYDKIKGYKSTTEKISKSEAKDAQSIAKRKEELLDLIEEQIEYENYLKEIYTEIKEQVAETALEYKKIEDALQSQIDAKEEELSILEEEFETENKITSLMEKRLALLKAMDDTRYTYITGQGESVFTYDVSNVNALKQELGQAQREEEQDARIEAIQEEIDKMNENLDKTKEIHSQQLAILELQESKVSEMLDLLSENLDTNLSDTMDKIYEDLTDVYIDELQTELNAQTGLLEEILNAINGRETIASSGITQTIDSGSNWATKTITHTVSKDETLDSIASMYDTSVEKLLKLNTSLKKDSVLQYGQSLRVPAKFDTGGYTGDFGNDGKLAVLHEKELVLNKQDTSNVLEAVDIARNIAKGFATSSIGANTLESITNNNNTTNEQQQIIQNMNIYGVQDANAFSNEMQKIFRNGMARLS